MRSIVTTSFGFLVAAFFASAVSAQGGGVAEQDSLALVALYNSTDGDNWKTNSGWLTDQVSNWYGVTLSSNRVISLTLNDPKDDGNLSFDGNGLNGSLPSEIGSLSELRDLDLRENQLLGPLPPKLGQLTDLQELHLYGNQISGSLPTELKKLESLQEASLERNQLTGFIPR